LTARKYKRPASPEAIAAARRASQEVAADIARLSAQPDVRAVVDAGGRIIAANRMDAFAQLLNAPRPAISQDEFNAARRFEADIAAGQGVDWTPGGDGTSTFGPMDRRLAAQDRIRAVLTVKGRFGCTIVGHGQAVILEALILPQFEGKTLPWRETVENTARVKDERQQTALVRDSCRALVTAYAQIDYAERKSA